MKITISLSWPSDHLTVLTYNKLMNQAVTLYKDGEYLAAYDLVTRNATKVEGNPAQIFNFRYSFACKSGRPGLAMYILKEAVIDRGFWYPYDHLLSDDDLEPLRDLPEFRRMADICREREIAAKDASRPELTLVLPKGDGKEQRVVLVALHGNEENARQAQALWTDGNDPICMMAFPQSSEVGFTDGHYWNDMEKGVSELRTHIRHILDRFSLEGKDMVLGGFSAGARVVLHALLDDDLEVGGFILVAPWLPDLEVLEPRMPSLRRKGVRGFVICGDQDPDCKGATARLAHVLEREGIPHRYMSVPGLDHDLPDGFPSQVPAIIDYVKEGEYEPWNKR